MIVAVNAGHCPGKDSGAVGKISKEVNLTRAIALEVCKQLEIVGVKVVFVQEQSLATVCRIANSEKADVFISIHCNAAENKSANGTETFYWTSDTKSRTLGRSQDSQQGFKGRHMALCTQAYCHACHSYRGGVHLQREGRTAD